MCLCRSMAHDEFGMFLKKLRMIPTRLVLLNAFNAQTRPLNQGWAKDQRQTLGIRS